MSQLHVDLPNGMSELVEAEAARRRITPSELVRQAVNDYLARPRRKLGIIGLGSSGQSDISERVDEEVKAALGL